MRGFTLVELLIATALTLAALGVALQVSAGARVSVGRDTAAVDLAQRLRSGSDVIERAVRNAGLPLDLWPPAGARTPVPAIEPLLDSEDEEASGHEVFSALRLTTPGRGRARLRAPALPSGPLRLESPPHCPGAGLCGFAVGDTVLVLDEAGVSDLLQVAALDPSDWSLVTDRDRDSSYAAGALVLAVDVATFRVTTGSSGAPGLLKTTAAGARLPILDHMVWFEVRVYGSSIPPQPALVPDDAPSYGPRSPPLGVDDPRDPWPAGENCIILLSPAGIPAPRLAMLGDPGALVELTPTMLADGPWCAGSSDGPSFDADLLRIRRVDVTLRAEAPSPRARGSAGPLFARTGSGQQASGWVPDGSVHLSIAVRGGAP